MPVSVFILFDNASRAILLDRAELAFETVFAVAKPENERTAAIIANKKLNP
jgi:hypothetical protein